MTFSLASLTSLAKYLRLGRIYDLIHVLLHVWWLPVTICCNIRFQITCSFSSYYTKILTNSRSTASGRSQPDLYLPSAMFQSRSFTSFIQTRTRNIIFFRTNLVAGINTIACVSSLYPELKYRDASVLSAQPYCDIWFHSERFGRLI